MAKDELAQSQLAAREADGDRITLLTIGTLILTRRRTIIRWIIVVAALAVLPKLFGKRLYAGTASLVPQAADARSSGLASLAGQFGVTIPGSNQSQSPDFYAALMKTNSQLRLIARDTFTVPELGGQRVSFYDLYNIPAGSIEKRDEDAIGVLVNIVSVGVTKPTGIIDVRVATPWPSVSFEIVKALLRNVDDFNRRTRQSQASAERRFLASRLDSSRQTLTAAENRLVQFNASNRSFIGASELTVERDRLQRQVQMQQAVFTSLTQAYEDARIREVRDTPVITIVDAPVMPVYGLPRGRVRRGILGIMAGFIAGLLWVLVRQVIDARREAGDLDAIALGRILDEVSFAAAHPFDWLRARMRSPKRSTGQAAG
jgi:uncharacterized protein involved in exopolysaccharide biosynthesis